jgi:hypothetical protein
LRSCLGFRSLERGQSRVPEPPAKITGMIKDKLLFQKFNFREEQPY